MSAMFTAFLAMLLPAAAFAQGTDSYPSRAVTIIVPLAPGAATDAEGRVWASKLSESLGQQFVMDFKPGGSMTLGLTYAARQKPDGYTLAYVSSTYTLLPLLYKDLPFDTAKSFEFVSLLSKRAAMLAVANNFPVHNIQEYIAYAKANPEKINFATSGNSSVQYMMGLWLTNATNTKVTYIHYKASGAAYPDVLAGRVQMFPTTFSGGYPMVKAGKARAIGVANLQRSKLLPDLPTIVEQGIPDYEYPSWLGLMAPEKTPSAIVNKLQAEAAKIAKMPDVQQRLGEDTTLVANTPEQYRRLVAAETERWRKLVIDNNIKFDEPN